MNNHVGSCVPSIVISVFKKSSIIFIDNDNAKEAVQRQLMTEMKREKIVYIVSNMCDFCFG